MSMTERKAMEHSHGKMEGHTKDYGIMVSNMELACM